MILRRLSEAIVKQNWSIVTVEVLVVVVGIFIGLQVDDWNQARKDGNDELRFLERLHNDLLLADQLSQRVRARRLERQGLLLDASDVLFGRADRDTLSEEECFSVASANFFNINIADFPSMRELAGTGRMHIIQDAELRSALVHFEQVKGALTKIIEVQTIASEVLSHSYPDLIQLRIRFDADLDEAISESQCDTQGMRANQAFLNDFSVSVDRYDAYVRDGLAPWSAQFDKVHQLVDDALDIGHE